MRVDPQANYLSQSRQGGTDNQALPAMAAGSPLKMALTIVVIGFLAGGAFWMFGEGIGGRKQANADGSGYSGLNESVIQYAESVVGSKDAQQVQPTPKARAEPVRPRAQRRSREEFAEARAAMAMGRDKEAVEHLKEAIRLDPGYADAHYRLGLLYVQLGDHAAARQEQAYLKSLDVDDLANLLGHLVDN